MPRPRSRRPSTPLERYAADYDAWFEAPPGALQFPGEVDALRLLLRDLPRPWLEVGAGTGHFGSLLGADLGLDPSRAMLRRAWERGLPVVQGAGERLPFGDASFGGAFMITTLCFLSDPERALLEAHRTLRPDGGLLVADVLADRPWGLHYREQGRQGHPLYRYAQFHTLREMEELLGKAGFRVTRRACSVIQPPDRVREEERGWWGVGHTASFAALLSVRRES
ncbi:MAG: class I SAM-dependent methyltransferase [Chloroflexi bacterium]|nr:class I SAM-dependent methyltransferase [Chloroflexota bacterium]